VGRFAKNGASCCSHTDHHHPAADLPTQLACVDTPAEEAEAGKLLADSLLCHGLCVYGPAQSCPNKGVEWICTVSGWFCYQSWGGGVVRGARGGGGAGGEFAGSG
jgi:hypothetical protein